MATTFVSGSSGLPTEESLRSIRVQNGSTSRGDSGIQIPPPVQLTAETEALLGLLLRPRGELEEMVVAVVAAVARRDDRETLAAAMALADKVQETLS